MTDTPVAGQVYLYWRVLPDAGVLERFRMTWIPSAVQSFWRLETSRDGLEWQHVGWDDRPHAPEYWRRRPLMFGSESEATHALVAVLRERVAQAQDNLWEASGRLDRIR